MYLLRLLRWLRGYVRFSVRSGSLERLLNLCTRHGIPVWGCRRDETTAVGCTTVSGYHALRPLTRKTAIRVRVDGRYGAPFLQYRYRRRIGILAGLAVFAAFLIAAQQFVWDIKVEGCDKATTEQQLCLVLEKLGVKRGVLKKKIDLYDIARGVELEVNSVSWAALNLHGTTAILKIRERTPPPPKIDTGVPANVVAARDGQIVKLQVTDGKPLLKAGDTVRAGEMIVSGVREDRWGATHLIRANAKVIAHVPATLAVEIPLAQEEQVPDGRVVRRSYLEVFGLRLPLFLYTELEGSYHLERASEPLRIGKKEMPVAISKENYQFYQVKQIKLSEADALQMAKKELARLEQEEFGSSTVLARAVAGDCAGGVLTLRGEYELEMDIAKQVEIGVLERAKDPKPEREGGY